MEKIIVVNVDGWYGEVLNCTGNYSKLFKDKKFEHELVNVKIIGYTDVFNQKNRFGGMEKQYSIGKVVSCIRANFKPYPEYLGVSAGKWVRQ